MEEDIKVEIKFPEEYWHSVIKQLRSITDRLGFEIAMQLGRGEKRAKIQIYKFNPLLKKSFKSTLEERGCKVSYIEYGRLTTMDLDFENCEELQIENFFGDEDEDEEGSF